MERNCVLKEFTFLYLNKEMILQQPLENSVELREGLVKSQDVIQVEKIHTLSYLPTGTPDRRQGTQKIYGLIIM